MRTKKLIHGKGTERIINDIRVNTFVTYIYITHT